MTRWAIALLGLAGCDLAWGLQHQYECPANDDDCDHLLDLGDPCPGDYGDAKDEDGDGVGDACDPNMGLPGDAIGTFDGFANDNHDWTLLSGDAFFTYHDSSLAQDDIADGVVLRYVQPDVQPTLEVSISDIVFEGEGSAVGIYVSNNSNIPLECRVVHHEGVPGMSAPHDDLMLIINPDAPLFPTTAPRLPGKPTDTLRIYGSQATDGTIRCRARYGDNDGLSVDPDPFWKSIPPRQTIDRVALRTIRASAHFKAVTLFGVP